VEEMSVSRGIFIFHKYGRRPFTESSPKLLLFVFSIKITLIFSIVYLASKESTVDLAASALFEILTRDRRSLRDFLHLIYIKRAGERMKVYLVENPELLTEKLFTEYIEILPFKRRQRAMGYQRMLDRKLCILSYLLLWYGLFQEYELTSPPVFGYGERGKPYLKDYPNIYFNLSHCIRGAVCVVSDCETGVDIQEIRNSSTKMAKKICSPREYETIVSTQDQAKALCRLWTMKESYLKRIGKGIFTDISAVDTTKILHYYIFSCDRFVLSANSAGPNATELCNVAINDLRMLLGDVCSVYCLT
jgi:4'-phosphopantetheinyl transferase